jgi:hypothetical protein
MRLWSIEQWMNDPVTAQHTVLQDLLASGQNTEFGREHKFSYIQSLADYKKRIRIREYDDLKPYIERMMQGEENVLWNTPVTWFAKSSGTTSEKSKFIPVSDESLKKTITGLRRMY